MVAGILASEMSPPATPKSNSDRESEQATNKELDVTSITGKPSELPAALSPESSSGNLKNFRPFAPLPSFSGRGGVNHNPDATSVGEIHIPTEPTKVFADRHILSKHQLPISQWPMYTSYVATAAEKRSKSPLTVSLDENPSRAKHEDILDYVYDWAAWAAEIPDPSRRFEVLQYVMRTLERVLKSGIKRTGMMLVPTDVRGARSGTKKTQEGEVNIQVTITTSLNNRAERNLEKLAVPKANNNPVKDKKADADAAAAASPGPTPEEVLSIEEASKGSLTKGKRTANEMDQSNLVLDIKRQKTEHLHLHVDTQAETASTADEHTARQLHTHDKSSSESVPPMSQAEVEKRARYRQQIFQLRLNHILKKAGKVQTRGKCTKWETVLARLRESGVAVKWRNLMLRDFYTGHEAWNDDGNIDPNEELARYAEHGFERTLGKAPVGDPNKVEPGAALQAAEPNGSERAALITELETLPTLNIESSIPDAFIPAQPRLAPDQPTLVSDLVVQASSPVVLETTASDKLIVTLRTFQGFNPEDYSIYNEYQHENFMFTFRPTSTVKERVMISDPLISQIDAKLDTAIEDGSDLLDGGRLFIRSERGKIVATGNFVDLNSEYMIAKGMAHAEDPWAFKGKVLGVDWRYHPSMMARPKAGGEALAVKIGEE